MDTTIVKIFIWKKIKEKIPESLCLLPLNLSCCPTMLVGKIQNVSDYELVENKKSLIIFENGRIPFALHKTKMKIETKISSICNCAKSKF